MDRGMRPSMFLLEINDTTDSTYLHRGISNYNFTMDTLCINVFGDNANLGNNSAYSNSHKHFEIVSSTNKRNKYLLSFDVSNVQIILPLTRGKCLTLIIPCIKSRYLFRSNMAPLRDNKLIDCRKFAPLLKSRPAISRRCAAKNQDEIPRSEMHSLLRMIHS